MSPEDFKRQVIFRVATQWERGCLCHHPGFRKLLSFNFQDYGMSPMQCIDTEILAQHVTTQYFRVVQERKLHSDHITGLVCLNCKAHSEATYSEYSISMYRTCIRYIGLPPSANHGLFIIGIHGFSQTAIESVHDFKPASNLAEFLQSIGVSESVTRPCCESRTGVVLPRQIGTSAR